MRLTVCQHGSRTYGYKRHTDGGQRPSEIMKLRATWFHLNCRVYGRTFKCLLHGNVLGPGSSVGIATELRAGRSGDRIPVGGEIFRICPDRPWGPPSLLYNGYRVFPGGKERPGIDADPSPPFSAVVMKGQSYTSTPPTGRKASIECSSEISPTRCNNCVYSSQWLYSTCFG